MEPGGDAPCAGDPDVRREQRVQRTAKSIGRPPRRNINGGHLGNGVDAAVRPAGAEYPSIPVHKPRDDALQLTLYASLITLELPPEEGAAIVFNCNADAAQLLVGHGRGR
jgi:hypothetical protein